MGDAEPAVPSRDVLKFQKTSVDKCTDSPYTCRVPNTGCENMFSASDLRKGLRIEIDGSPYLITEFNFVKPGKGQGLYTCKLKNLANGSTMTRTYRDNVVIDEPKLEQKNVKFSYANGDRLVFMDANFEEVTLEAATMGDSKAFLVEEMEVGILYHNGRPIDPCLTGCPGVLPTRAVLSVWP